MSPFLLRLKQSFPNKKSLCQRKIFLHLDPELLKTVVTLTHELSGNVTVPGSPLKFHNPLGDNFPAPLLGEHNSEVLTDFGLSNEQIEKLNAIGIIHS